MNKSHRHTRFLVDLWREVTFLAPAVLFGAISSLFNPNPKPTHEMLVYATIERGGSGRLICFSPS